MSSILPSFAMVTAKQTEIDNPPVEYGIDLKTGQLTGEIVSGLEAVEVWVWLALHSERYRYPIFSWKYGAELEQYIGQGYSAEFLEEAVKDDVEACLVINPYIRGIDDFSCKIENDRLVLNFTVKTDYGEVEISV